METPERRHIVANMDTTPLFTNFLHSPALSGVLPFAKKPLEVKDSPVAKSSCQKSLFNPPAHDDENKKDDKPVRKHEPRSLFAAEETAVEEDGAGAMGSLAIYMETAADSRPVPDIKEFGFSGGELAAAGFSSLAFTAADRAPFLAVAGSPIAESQSSMGGGELTLAAPAACTAGAATEDRFLSQESSIITNHDAFGSERVSEMEKPSLLDPSATETGTIHGDAVTEPSEGGSSVRSTKSLHLAVEEPMVPLTTATPVWSTPEDISFKESQTKTATEGYLSLNATKNPAHGEEDATAPTQELPPTASKIHATHISCSDLVCVPIISDERREAENAPSAAKETAEVPASAPQKPNPASTACTDFEGSACSSKDSKASSSSSESEEDTGSESSGEDEEEEEEEEEEESEDDVSKKPRAANPRKAYKGEAKLEIKSQGGSGRELNPGRRMRGNRIYDSVLGQTCHWCRQKTVEDHVQCWKCPIRFCGMCLLNRNGEYIRREMVKNVRWLCPKCRGGCGPGCDNCCNCGPCRREQRMGPTGQIIRICRAGGFSNAHDYLVHQETGELPRMVAARKTGRGWVNGGTAMLSDTEETYDYRSSSKTEARELVDTCEDMDIDPPGGEAYKEVYMKTRAKRKGTEPQDGLKKMRGSVDMGTSTLHTESNRGKPRPGGRPPKRLASLKREPPQDRPTKPKTEPVELQACKVEPGPTTLTKPNLASARVKLEKLEASAGAGQSRCLRSASSKLVSTSVKLEKLERTVEDDKVMSLRGGSCVQSFSGVQVKIEKDGNIPQYKRAAGHLESSLARSPASRSCVDDAYDQETQCGGLKAKVKAESSVEDAILSQSSSCKHDLFPMTKNTITGAREAEPKAEDYAEDVILSQESSCMQAPPPVPRMPSNSWEEGRSFRQKEGLSQNPSSSAVTANGDDTQTSCFSSHKRQRKDALSGDKWSLPSDVQGDAYSQKLKEVLAEPLDCKQLAEMWDLASRRKPLLKLRQTRGRTMHVTTADEGLSYLDHHPDLSRRLRELPNPVDKLALLRGFFFWLQHSCMEGAFKPWALVPSQTEDQGDDCMLTDGPDCEVLAVVLSLDEKKDVSCLVKPADPIVIDLDDGDVGEAPALRDPARTASSGATMVQKAINCSTTRRM